VRRLARPRPMPCNHDFDDRGHSSALGFGFQTKVCYTNAMRLRPRRFIGALLGVLIAVAMIAQGASAAVMDPMMSGDGMASSGHMPCGSCDGKDDSPAFPCAVPCLAGPAVLLSLATIEVPQARPPVSRAGFTRAGIIRAPDPNPPQL
jgi:hypothetical protein